MSINIDMGRAFLRDVQVAVRKHKPTVKLKDAWVWKVGRDHWEFHYGPFYWHGSGDNAYDARANGWSAWLRSENVEGWSSEGESGSDTPSFPPPTEKEPQL